MWCIGKIDREYRERMYDIIALYERPYAANEPVICVDEKSKQLLGTPHGTIAGKIRKVDYEYTRNGTRNIFVAVEPKAGKRTTKVTKRRKKEDFAQFIKALIARYPTARIIHIVLDNLNTHFAKSFTDTFDEEEAERILNRIQFHYTPKHASWLDMAEIEIGSLDRQCLNQRIPTEKRMKQEIKAWENKRNKSKATISWTFSKQNADQKLGKHYI